MDKEGMSYEDTDGASFLDLINGELNKPHVQTADTSSPSPLPVLQDPSPDTGHHLSADAFSEPTVPIDGLSQQNQDYINTVTDAFGCPRDYVTVACLVVAGVAAGKKATLDTNPYTNYPCAYVGIVGKPSRNKSGPLYEVSGPLMERDRAGYKKYLLEKSVYEQNRIGNKVQSGDRPVFRQLVANDSSPESRNVMLAQGDMILFLSDELKSFIDSFGRYSKNGSGAGAEISQLLSIWSNKSFTVNRKTEEPLLINDPANSIIGGIQPGPLGRTFGTDVLMDSGFNQRFLFVVPEKASFVRRCSRKKMSTEMRGYWGSFIGMLLDRPPQTLHLSHEAERLYQEYADDNDIKADKEDDDYIGAVIQKMNVHVLRLAIMAHLLSDTSGDPVITARTMEYAVRLAEYFKHVHTDIIYPLLMGQKLNQKRLTKELVITEIGQTFDIGNKSALAEALGYDRAKLTNIINGKLRK
jgi:hypothetical protein